MTNYIEERSKTLKESTTKMVEELSCYYQGNWVLDVGSNSGMFIEAFLDRFPNTSVLAFEPVKRYYNFSVKRFENNSNVFIENAALGDVEGSGIIHVAKNNIGWNTMIQEKADEDNKEDVESIHIKRFDNYLDYTGLDAKFDIVKIDTEGYEYKVLNGMRRFLKDQKPTIVCEIGWGINHPHWEEELAAFEYLFSIGYDRSVESQIRELKGTIDIIFRV